MTTNFKVTTSTNDISTLCKSYTSGVKQYSTGFISNGQDICNILSPYVAGKILYTSNFYVNSNNTSFDIFNLFQNVGTGNASSNVTISATAGNTVNCIYFDNSNNMYIGGIFTTINSITGFNNFAKYDGTSWINFTSSILSGEVKDIVVTKNASIYIGTTSNLLNYIATYNYNNSQWETLSSGLPNTATVLEYDPDKEIIWIGGVFGNPLNRVCYYNISTNSFNRIPPGTNTCGVNALCNAITRANNDIVYFGGEFTFYNNNSATSTRCNYLCSYANSNFNILGSDSNISGCGVNNTVQALAYDSSNSKLYVGGTFTIAYNSSVSSINASRIACWDENTRQWSSIGPGFNGGVNGLAINNGVLYATGGFTKTGDNITSIPYVAAYVNSTWVKVNSSVNGTGNAVNVNSNNELFIGGNFGFPYRYLFKIS
jgi:hypothetical protein